MLKKLVDEYVSAAPEAHEPDLATYVHVNASQTVTETLANTGVQSVG